MSYYSLGFLYFLYKAYTITIPRTTPKLSAPQSTREKILFGTKNWWISSDRPYRIPTTETSISRPLLYPFFIRPIEKRIPSMENSTKWGIILSGSTPNSGGVKTGIEDR